MNFLKYKRVERGLSQASLAVAARVDQSELSQIELGRYIAGPTVLNRLAQVLGVPADVLLKPVSIKETHERPRDSSGRYVEAAR